MTRKQIGSIAAAAALAILTSATALEATADTHDGGVKCAGVNSCKGESECKTATSDCKGLNHCKGEGWVTKSSEKECVAAGGKVLS